MVTFMLNTNVPVVHFYSAAWPNIPPPLTFTVGPDSRILLTGANGAGKTTLLRLIMRQERPDRGEVSVAAGARICYLPQEPSLVKPSNTVLGTYRGGLVGFEEDFVKDLIRNGLFRFEDLSPNPPKEGVGLAS